jgi:hypothetical protein
MPIEEIDFEHTNIQMKYIWGMEELFGEEAHEELAKGFTLNLDNHEPEGIVLKFARRYGRQIENQAVLSSKGKI